MATYQAKVNITFFYSIINVQRFSLSSVSSHLLSYLPIGLISYFDLSFSALIFCLVTTKNRNRDVYVVLPIKSLLSFRLSSSYHL